METWHSNATTPETDEVVNKLHVVLISHSGSPVAELSIKLSTQPCETGSQIWQLVTDSTR